jgi:hypothetical protein
MANEHEIERLVVRIDGDNRGAVKSFEDTAKAVTASTNKIVGDLEKVHKAQENLRHNSLLDELWGELSNKTGPIVDARKQTAAFFTAVKEQQYRQAQTSNYLAAVEEKNAQEKIDFQDRVAAALKRHEEGERRLAREIEKRAKVEEADRKAAMNSLNGMRAGRGQRNITGTIDLEGIRDRDRKAALGSLMGMRRAGGGGPPGGPNIVGDVAEPMKEATGSAIGFNTALTALASTYVVLNAAQTAMQNDLDKLNDSLREGAALNQKISEARQHIFSEADEDRASKPIKDRIGGMREELANLQKEVEGQKSKFDADKTAVENARGPMFIGAALRNLPGIGTGKQADLDVAEKTLEVSTGNLEQTRKRIKDLQRDLQDYDPGGDKAEQAFNRFKTRMTEQADIVGKSHKAILLARLTHEQNLTESQQREAEALYDALEKKKEAYRKSQEVVDQYFDAEMKAIEAGERMEEKIFSADPVKRYRKEMEELVYLMDQGLISSEAFGMGVDQLTKKIDGEASGKNRSGGLHKVSAALSGSANAMSRQQDYSFQLRGAPGQHTDPAVKELQEIKRELKMLNKKPGATLKPLNS